MALLIAPGSACAVAADGTRLASSRCWLCSPARCAPPAARHGASGPSTGRPFLAGAVGATAGCIPRRPAARRGGTACRVELQERSLCGRWTYERDGSRHQYTILPGGSTGKYRFEEKLSNGVQLGAELETDGEWATGRMTHRGQSVGSIRIRSCGSDTQVSNFRKTDEDDWSEDTIATKVKVELPVKIKTKGVPVYLYAPIDEVEEQARNQLISLAESPLPTGHVSAMPDVHMGKGVAIGAVFASEKYVCPNAVGVDIGCGMCAVPVADLFKDDLDEASLRRIQALLKQRIPTSFDSHGSALPWARKTIEDITGECPPSKYLQQRIEKDRGKGKIHNQLGTLGGGNHFIEVVYSESDQQVWCMLHSGSRNVGNTTAEHYDNIAGEEGHFLRGVAGSLNYLEVDSPSGQGYLKDMTWCQAYARENRRSMLDVMTEAVEEVTGRRAEMDRVVNAHHNFCQCETCQVRDPATGKMEERKLWVTRKGATSAREGQYGIIPGSMGVGSYIVKGRGSRGSWQSCSHGAGRTMSRTKARKIIPQEEFEASMQGIICDSVDAVKDEAPQAYKDLSTVLSHQSELVQVEHRLLPLVNVKGFEDKPFFNKGSKRGKRSGGSKKQQGGRRR